MTTPHVGQVVLITNLLSNGLNVHPAMITRVWNYREQDAQGMVNVTIFPDAAAPVYHTSISFFPDELSAKQHLAKQGSYSAVKIVCYAKD